MAVAGSIATKPISWQQQDWQSFRSVLKQTTSLSKCFTGALADALSNRDSGSFIHSRYKKGRTLLYCKPSTTERSALLVPAWAIAGLEQFVQSVRNPLVRWNAAYTLGKTFAPGNPVAIAALIQLLHSIRNESLRLQIGESLGKVDPGNPVAIATLTHIIESTQQDTLRRKAAFSLGKIAPSNPVAIATLVHMVESAANPMLQLQAAENLMQIDPGNAVATAVIPANRKVPKRPSRSHRAKQPTQWHIAQAIAALEQRLASVEDASTQRRLASQLGKLSPGHPRAIQVLLALLESHQSSALYKRAMENLKDILLDEQLPIVVSTLKPYGLAVESGDRSVQAQECYKLLWFCSQQLSYFSFYRAWHKVSRD
jgi:HEAT repeat protein